MSRKRITPARVIGKLRYLANNALLQAGLKSPALPQQAGMARFQKKGIWHLNAEQCPCDLHFLDYLRARSVTGRTIFHFGTGAHHVLGLENALFAAPNDILAVTAAEPEHAAYVNRVVADPSLAQHYQVWFTDIYNLNENLLPAFDLVSLFHLGEFHMPERSALVRHDDESLLRMMHRKLRPGGTLLLFSQSLAWDTASNLAEKLTTEGLLEPADEWKSLRLYTARHREVNHQQ